MSHQVCSPLRFPYIFFLGCVSYDWFMGRQLNPRFGPLDLKFFCELRPGLIGWAALNWIFVFEGYTTGKMTPALALVAIFQTLYVADALFFEVRLALSARNSLKFSSWYFFYRIRF
jgi:hypothetical protein